MILVIFTLFLLNSYHGAYGRSEKDFNGKSLGVQDIPITTEELRMLKGPFTHYKAAFHALQQNKKTFEVYEKRDSIDEDQLSNKNY